jgi:hypothetical protein
MRDVSARSLAALLVLLLTPTSAWTWSSPAHQAIADAAQARLTPAAQAALAQILQGTTVLAPGALAGVATWPDDIRIRAAHGTIAAGWSQADVDEADRFNMVVTRRRQLPGEAAPIKRSRHGRRSCPGDC